MASKTNYHKNLGCLRKRNNYCVIRAFPTTIFIEAIGDKGACEKYAKKAAKPYLRLCKMIPIIRWDKHGKQVAK